MVQQKPGRKFETLKGAALILAASICYGIQPTFVNLGIKFGADGDIMCVYEFLFCAILSAFIVIMTQKSLRLSGRHILTLLLLGTCGFFLCEALRVTSYKYIPISASLLFHFCFPAIVTIIMVAVFKERITSLKIISILMAFTGIVLTVDLSVGINPLGAILALLSGVVYGIYIIGNDKSDISEIPVTVCLFYYTSISAVLFLLQALIKGKSMTLPAASLGMAAITAISAGIIATLAFMEGVRILGASTAAILNNLEPVAGIIVSVIVFSENITVRSVIACVLIVTASILTSVDSARKT